MPPSPDKFLTPPISQLCKLGFSINDPRFTNFVRIYMELRKFNITVLEVLTKFAHDNKVDY